MVTNQEIEEVAEKTGLEVEEIRNKLRLALLSNAKYVPIAGPKGEAKILLFSIKASPDEEAEGRKWLSDHAADLIPVPDYMDGGVDLMALEGIETTKHLIEIAKNARPIRDKESRTVYAENVRRRKERYIKPKRRSPSNWFELAAKEFEAWEHRPRISDNKIKRRLGKLRKSSKTRRNCPHWFRDDVAVFVVLLLRHSWEKRADKIGAEEIRRDLDAVKYWTYGVVPDDSPLLGLTDDNIRVLVDRLRKFGNENLPSMRPWKSGSFEDVAMFLWQLLENTSSPKMTRPFAALRRAMQLSHLLLNTPIPLHPRYFKTRPPDSSER